MKHRAWFFILPGLLLGAGCGGSPEPSPVKSGRERVILRLNWYPEVEHGGFYAALVHGDFADEGLDVEIQPGGPGSAVIPEVALGRAQFGVDNADKLLVGRSEKTPVVALLAPLQRSPVCVMTHRGAGFKSVRDLRDVTLAMSTGAPFSSFLRKTVPLEGVRIVPYEGSVALFLRDPKFAQQGYVFSEPILAESQGADPVALSMADIGYNPYSSILITNETLIRDKPELVAKMVRACRRGWRRYAEDSAQTNVRLAKVNTLVPLDVVTKMSEALKPLVVAGLQSPAQVGTMESGRWTDLLAKLESCGVVKPGTVRVEDAFSLKFLEPEVILPSAVTKPNDAPKSEKP